MAGPKSLSPQQLEAMLEQTLHDQVLSRSEDKALREVIYDADPDWNRMAAFRSIAFDLARRNLDSGKQTRNVIDWLEAVVKVLSAREREDNGPSSEAHFSPGNACLQRIVGLLSASRKRVEICVFTITDDRIAEAILKCHRRGVKVRIISDDDKAFDRGSDVQRLREAGVELRVDNSPAHMHHKFAVFDGELLLTGSYNWTRSAARDNYENVIVTNDPRLSRAFIEHFDLLWEQLH